MHYVDWQELGGAGWFRPGFPSPCHLPLLTPWWSDVLRVERTMLRTSGFSPWRACPLLAVPTEMGVETENLWIPTKDFVNSQEQGGRRMLKVRFQHGGGWGRQQSIKVCVPCAESPRRPFVVVNHRRKLCFDIFVLKTHQPLCLLSGIALPSPPPPPDVLW